MNVGLCRSTEAGTRIVELHEFTRIIRDHSCNSCSRVPRPLFELLDPKSWIRFLDLEPRRSYLPLQNFIALGPGRAGSERRHRARLHVLGASPCLQTIEADRLRSKPQELNSMSPMN